jgi:hypothetical protein
VDAAASLGFDVCALQFMFPIGVPLEFLAPYGLGPILASRTVKLSTLMAGFFLEADASVDANATWYLTSVNVVSSGKRR